MIRFLRRNGDEVTFGMVTIHVTQKIIKSSMPCNNENCAVANAIKVVLKDEYRVSVCQIGINVFSSDQSQVVKLDTPPLVLEFIKDYDAGKPVGSIEFKLNLPQFVLM